MSVKEFFGAIKLSKQLQKENTELEAKNAELSKQIKEMNDKSIEIAKSIDSTVESKVRERTKVLREENDELNSRIEGLKKDLKAQQDILDAAPKMSQAEEYLRNEYKKVCDLLDLVNQTHATKAQKALYDAINELRKKL